MVHGQGGEGSVEGQPHEPPRQAISWKDLTLVAPVAPLVPGSHRGAKLASGKEVGDELVEKHCSLLHSLELGFLSYSLPGLDSLQASWFRWFQFLSLPSGSFRLF